MVTAWAGADISSTLEEALAEFGRIVSIAEVDHEEVLVRRVPFTLKLVHNATLQIEAPFEPKKWYRIHVMASDRIRDGYGLPLAKSAAHFQMVCV